MHLWTTRLYNRIVSNIKDIALEINPHIIISQHKSFDDDIKRVGI